MLRSFVELLFPFENLKFSWDKMQRLLQCAASIKRKFCFEDRTKNVNNFQIEILSCEYIVLSKIYYLRKKNTASQFVQI